MSSSHPGHRKRSLFRVMLGVVLIVALLSVVGCVWLVGHVASTPYPAIDLPVSIGTRTTIVPKSFTDVSEDRDWYISVEEAISSSEESERRKYISKPLAIIDSENRIDILYFAVFENRGNYVREFIVYRFDKKGEKVALITGTGSFAPADVSGFVGNYSYANENEIVGQYIINRLRPNCVLRLGRCSVPVIVGAR